MARIDVENGKSFEFKNPNVDYAAIQKVAEEAKGIILRAASPFVDNIKIFNKTKQCHVYLAFQEGKVVIVVENPQDEVFDLNQYGDLHKPVTMTGR